MKTPLYKEHIKLGAKMTEFAGWEMPLYYSGINDEVMAVRTAAGIFDLSHMGEFRISGPNALDLLQWTVTNDVSHVGIGDAQYNLMCDETGGVLDDLIIYRLGAEEYMPVVNASNILSDLAWMQRQNKFGAELINHSDKTALVAVQGPTAATLLQTIVTQDLSSMKRFRVTRDSIKGADTWIASTGYTGGPGYELYCSADDVSALWRTVVEAGERFGAKPAGLGARDVLRIEAGYPLYGHELDTETTPLDTGLMWAVKLTKEGFLGKEAIENAVSSGPTKCLIGLQAIDRCVPRHGYAVRMDRQTIGQVTSGTFSPTLQRGIAMAFVEPEYAQITEACIDIRGKSCPSSVVRMPFYRPNS